MPRGRITPNADFYDTDHDEWDNDWGDAADTRDVDDFDEFGDEFVYDEHPAAVFSDGPDDQVDDPAEFDHPAVVEAPQKFSDYGTDLELPHPDSSYDYDDFLRTPRKPERSDQEKQRVRKRFMAVGIAAAVATGVVLTVVLGGGGDDGSGAAGVTAAMPTSAPNTPSTVATAPAAGDVTSGPGVILGFDHAYYTSRDGEEAASNLVPSQNNPGTIDALQRDIDSTDPAMQHDIQITSTSSENVYNVLLTLTADGVPHEYHQQYTVVSQGGRFYIANKLTCDTVCPTP